MSTFKFDITGRRPTSEKLDQNDTALPIKADHSVTVDVPEKKVFAQKDDYVAPTTTTDPEDTDDEEEETE